MTYRMLVAAAAITVSGSAFGVLSAGWSVAGGLIILVTAALVMAFRAGSVSDDPVESLMVPVAIYVTLALSVGGGTVHAIRFESASHAELAGAAALGAAAVAIYMEARVSASLGTGIAGSGERVAFLADPVLLLVILGAGALFRGSFAALWASAGLASLTVAGRLTVLRLTGTGAA